MTREELAAFGVPAELQENPLLKDAKDVGTLAKIAVDLKAYQGTSIRIPGPEAPEADRKEFGEKLKRASNGRLVEIPESPEAAAPVEDLIFERLGRPKEVSGYKPLKDLGVKVEDGVTVNEDELRAMAHGLGLTSSQYAKMAKHAVAELTKQARLAGEQRRQLKTELGEALEERLALAAGTAKKLGRGEEYTKRLAAGAVPVEEVKAWLGVAKAVGGEAGEFGGQGAGGASTKLTPSEAREREMELRRNVALYDRTHPHHEELVKKLLEYTAAQIPDAG